jgi:hypothetical protein
MNIKFALILCFFGCVTVFSQETTTKEKETDDLIDSLFEQNQMLDELIDSMSKYQFLYVTLNYNNATYFSGRDLGINQFNLNPRVTYLHHSGIFASVSGIYYQKFDPKWDLTITSLGYGKSFGENKAFRFTTSYSRYFYNNSFANSFTNDLTLGIGVKNKKRTLGTTLSGTYLFGNDKSFQITSISFATIKLYKTSKLNLDFKPQLSFIGGKQTVELARTITRFGQTFTTYEQNNVVSLFNTQLSLPIQFNTNFFDIELGYNVNFPTAIGDETNLKNTNFFNVTMSYLFDL